MITTAPSFRAKESTIRQNRVWVRIASACNNKCLFCLDSDAQNGTFVNDSIIREQILSGYRDDQENKIIISGWEASINPRFPEYIRYAREVWYDRVQTVTNGNMFAVPAFCERVFSAGLQEVTFSFHGHNPTLHDYLVNTTGAFNKSLRGLIYIKKYHPEIIVNIDIVVNRANIIYLPEIVWFFMRLGVYEFDILHIIPFGRGFAEYKDQLFYDVREYAGVLREIWEMSRIRGVHIWTNRFPAEALEWFEELIQDPEKIVSETMWEGVDMFAGFIASWGKKKPDCFGEACDVCFLHQYCHDFMSGQGAHHLDPQLGRTILRESVTSGAVASGRGYVILRGQGQKSDIYKCFGSTVGELSESIRSLALMYPDRLINVPRCLGGSGIYETYDDMWGGLSVKEYTQAYITNLYRRKSDRCFRCKYFDSCQGIHINYIRSYGFQILQPII